MELGISMSLMENNFSLWDDLDSHSQSIPNPPQFT